MNDFPSKQKLPVGGRKWYNTLENILFVAVWGLLNDTGQGVDEHDTNKQKETSVRNREICNPPRAQRAGDCTGSTGTGNRGRDTFVKPDRL